MKSTTSSFSFFIICLCLISYAVNPASCLNLYEIVCSETGPDSHACLDLLKGDYKIVAATNYHDLSTFILDLAIFQAIAFQGYIEDVANHFTHDKAIRQCADEFYIKIIALFKTALGELENNPQNSKNDVQSAGNGATNCEKAIRNEREFNPNIHAQNNQMFLLSEIAFFSINHLT